jgi:hypothetical protein
MEKDIGKIKKNDMTNIVIRIDDFGGKTGVTIREFTTSDKYTGFTKSGTRIPADAFPQFREMINTINEKDLVVSASSSTASSPSAKGGQEKVVLGSSYQKPSSAKSSSKTKPKNEEKIPDEDLL